MTTLTLPDDLARLMEKEAHRRRVSVPELLRELLAKESAPAEERPEVEPKSIGNEPFVGMWKDRDDLQDTSSWVRALREREWR